MIKKYIKPEFVISCLIFLYLSYILILNPVIGKYNNGDFGRIMIISGVSDISQKYEDIYDNFVHTKYKVNFLSLLLPWGYDWTSEVLLIKLAVILNVNLSNDKIMDIRFLSMIYIILFTFSIFLIIKYFNIINNSPIFKWILGTIIFLIFCDISYISYFNSFYGEATSFVFLFITIGSAMYLLSKEKPTKFQVFFLWLHRYFLLQPSSKIYLY